MGKNNLKRHQNTCKGKKPPPPKRNKGPAKKKKEKQKKDKKGQHFFLTFQSPVKYKIGMKLAMKYQTAEMYIDQCIVGNEWGISQFNGHAHAYVKTKEKMKFEDFKKMWVEHTSTKIADLQSCKNVKCAIQYVSKEDVKCIQKNIDLDMVSLNCKAYLAAQQGPFNPGRYPYGNLARHQQVSYKEMFDHYRKEVEVDLSRWEEDNFDLMQWQKFLVKKLLNQNDRQVLWVYDPVGNHGKSTLAEYLADYHQALVLNNSKIADLARCYVMCKSPIVVMDYTKDTEEYINYGFLEKLKNGRIFSPKYESCSVKFKSVKVICFANFEPDRSKLVEDRWMIYQIDDEPFFDTTYPKLRRI